MRKISLDRRATIGLAIAGFIPAFQAAAQFRGQRPLYEGATTSQKPICSMSGAIVAYAQESKERRDFLSLAHTQCNEAIQRLKDILSDLELAEQTIEYNLRYLKGVHELTGRNVGIDKVEDYAELMSDLVSESRDVIGSIINAPDDVTDDEVIQLFKNFAAISLLNAAMFRMPSEDV